MLPPAPAMTTPATTATPNVPLNDPNGWLFVSGSSAVGADEVGEDRARVDRVALAVPGELPQVDVRPIFPVPDVGEAPAGRGGREREQPGPELGAPVDRPRRGGLDAHPVAVPVLRLP